MNNNVKRYGAPSVKKAFEILGVLSSSKEGLGVSEIARGLNMAKSTVHGMTSTLEELGAVMRDPQTKRYRLGHTLFELGRLTYSQIDLKTLARSIMEELMEKTQTSVFLGILNWDHVTVLDIVESRQDLKITAPIGTTIPLFAGAVGKVFLASMEEKQAEKIILSKGLTRFTKNTIVDPKLYYQELSSVKKKGYAVDDEEYILGVRAVASPIVGLGQLMAAIWVVGFKASLNEKKIKTIIKVTKEAAEAIRSRIQEQPGA
ncbi:MAG: IclR family transcriptional regulator [Deltaproteobacteria bacterium]|nr:IclR family transcriptional regulator [Deltaproteobacteria bacterium]MBW2340918.1 IclR family transcriptional regulator [Deltaproteobacteria bacterium]